MNATKVESPRSPEHFFIFGTPQLGSSPGPTYCHQNGYLNGLCNGTAHQSFNDRNGQYDLSRSLNSLHFISSRPTRQDFEFKPGRSLDEPAFSKSMACSDNKTQILFRDRENFDHLRRVLSNQKLNEMCVQLESIDDKDELKEIVHSCLKRKQKGSVSCTFCTRDLPVYADFPLVDGTLFLSAVKLSDSFVEIMDKSAEMQYMGFVCASCLVGKPQQIKCVSCKKLWNGSCFQIGTLYTYNILVSLPCCYAHVACKNCRKPVLDLEEGSYYFSYYSSNVDCPSCGESDYHFMKPLLGLNGISLAHRS